MNSAPEVGKTSTAPVPVIAMNGVAKNFGPTRAVRNVDLQLASGEIHALVGENGSGKSTLVKMLSGVHRPDSGRIEFSGVAGEWFAEPAAAHRRGIVTVFQEVLVAENMSVVDNLWMGTDGLIRARRPRAERRRLAQDVLAELLDAPPGLDTPVGSLDLSTRQACAIARALLHEPQVLILDESTSALDFETRTRLFRLVQNAAERGTAVVMITHRMDEIDEIADVVTVMRSGESVATFRRGSWDRDDLVHAMTGADRLVPAATTTGRAGVRDDDVVVRVSGVTLTPDAAAFDVRLHRGEIVGLAGLEGHGQDRFLRALRGESVASGQIEVVSADGAIRRVRRRGEAARAGIAYVPRERGRESGFPTLSILANFALPTISVDTRAGWYLPGRSRSRLAQYVDRLSIRMRDSSDVITTLSGGNQQKVIIARWLAAKPSILLLNDPTRGIDINAKRDLYRLFEELSSEGVTIVMLSTEVDEHLELMDRVLVFRENGLAAELPRDGLTRERLVGEFFGHAATEDQESAA